MKKKMYPAIISPLLLSLMLFTCVDPALAATKSYAAAYQSHATSTSVSVNEEDAKKIAFNHAMVEEEAVSFLKLKLDYDHDSTEYEIKFYVGNTEYEYDIDASTGDIRKVETGVDSELRNKDYPLSSSAPKGLISEAKAANIALNHAKVDEKDLALLKIKLDHEHNRVSEYEIEFYAGGTKYEYEIDPATGGVIKYSSTAEPDIRIPDQTQTTSSSPEPVDEAKAQKIALSRVNGATVSNIQIWTDTDDGKRVFEGKIVYKDMEYEFEIDPATGAVLEWDSESIYD